MSRPARVPALYRSPTHLAWLTTAAFVPFVAGVLYAACILVSAIQYADALAAGEPVSLETFTAAVAHLDGLQRPLHGLRLVGIVAFCCWLFRAASNLIPFGEPGDTPGVTVLYFFIPLVNLWQPLVMLSKVWIGSDPDRSGGYLPRAQPAHRMPFLLVAWWTACLADVALMLGTIALLRSVATAADFASGLRWALVGTIVDLVALLLMLAVVWSITRRQDERGAPRLPRSTITHGREPVDC